jgi:phage terminase large subunit
MSIAKLKTDIATLEEAILKQMASQFDFTRNQDGDLMINYTDGSHDTIPMIKFRPYQIDVQQALFLKGMRRFFLVRPRRSGKEVESWNLLIQSAIESPGMYMQIYPTNVRARMVLWDGAMLLEDNRSLKFLDMIPKRFVQNINNQEMTIKLTNGSVIRVLGSDIDPDKLRGVNTRGAVFSEFAFSDPRVLHILMPVFRQNNGWLILQTTYNGMNHAYQMMQDVKSNPDWYCREDSVESLVDEHGNRYVTDEMIDHDRKSGMPEYLIQQEYYSVILTNTDILYFSAEIKMLYEKEKIKENHYLANSRRVYSFYDLGWNDATSITMVQFDNDFNPHVVNYIENKNKTLEWYIQEQRRFCNSHNLLLRSHYIPHDGQKRDLNTGKNTVDFGNDLGEEFYIVPKPTSKVNAIQSMRQLSISHRVQQRKHQGSNRLFSKLF